MWIFKTKPFTHRRMHFRDCSWKDEILIKHISKHKHKFSHIGACTCAQEPKTYAHGRKLEFKSQKLTCTACFWLKDIFLRLVMKRQNVYWTYCWPQKINPLNLTMHMHTLSENLWALAENMCVPRKSLRARPVSHRMIYFCHCWWKDKIFIENIFIHNN